MSQIHSKQAITNIKSANSNKHKKRLIFQVHSKRLNW